MKTEILKVFNKISSFLGIIYATLTSLFGFEWIIFLIYLILNILDYITGTIKSRINNVESSNEVLIGIVKKNKLLDSNISFFSHFFFISTNWQ